MTSQNVQGSGTDGTRFKIPLRQYKEKALPYNSGEAVDTKTLIKNLAEDYRTRADIRFIKELDDEHYNQNNSPVNPVGAQLTQETASLFNGASELFKGLLEVQIKATAAADSAKTEAQKALMENIAKSSEMMQARLANPPNVGAADPSSQIKLVQEYMDLIEKQAGKMIPPPAPPAADNVSVQLRKMELDSQLAIEQMRQNHEIAMKNFEIQLAQFNLQMAQYKAGEQNKQNWWSTALTGLGAAVQRGATEATQYTGQGVETQQPPRPQARATAPPPAPAAQQHSQNNGVVGQHPSGLLGIECQNPNCPGDELGQRIIPVAPDATQFACPYCNTLYTVPTEQQPGSGYELGKVPYGSLGMDENQPGEEA